ncbi:MAG: LytR C-terminal domain-containing protein [Candidatus Ancillula sp.]|jgi:hypothetical protein|nr:LytR C-terminal domain-containing protein [Candidatus Ancillula sp.]
MKIFPREEDRFEALKVEYQQEKSLTTLTAFGFIFLALFLVLALVSIYTLFGMTPSASKSSAQAKYPLPCVENSASAVPASSISVRVLNGSNMPGFGTAVGDSLTNRGFLVRSVETYTTSNDTQIRFGQNAIVQAYTLAGHFTNATLILDDREDGLIDVIIGRSFSELQDRYLVMTTDTTSPLASPEKCLSVLDIKKQPAIKHDATLVPAYGSTDETSDLTGQTASGAQ